MISWFIASGLLLLATVDAQQCFCCDSYTVSESVQFEAPAERVTAWTCKSTETEACELAYEESYTTGVTTTVTGELAGGIDLTKVLSAAVGAGFSYSWSTEETQTTGVTLICPAGQITCGAQAIVTKVETKGQKTETYYYDYEGSCGPGQFDLVGDYDNISPATNPNAEPGKQTIIEFQACLDSCDTQAACDAAAAEGLPNCP